MKVSTCTTWSKLATVLAAASTAIAQSSSTSTAPAAGQTPTGNYTGPLRPQVHFSPPRGFMNDPNGMFVDANGTYHLYYQYNPTATVAGNQHWGHATSKDLYTWTNQPIAIYPPNATSGIFSGSAVVDVNNTSGMFNNTKNGVVAIYTLNTPTQQTQDIAFSYDNGFTFTNYTGNPILSIGSTQFRDPKVLWYQDHWVMVVAYSVDFTIGIYTSPNLINWTFASNFSHAGLLGLQYECPNLVQLPIENSTSKAWMLYVSINPGAPLGGSVGEYFVGDFNGTHFSPFDRAARIADFAKDNYASQWFYNTDISIAWASNWQYTNSVPSGASEGWASSMSLPRRNYIANATRIGYVLGSEPYNLGPILDSQLASSANLVNNSINVNYSSSGSGAVYFQVNITYPTPLPGLPPNAALNFTFSSSASNENVKGGYYFGSDNSGALWLDRGGVNGFDNTFFTDKFSVTQVGQPLAYSIEGVVDRSIIEVFLDKGHFSGTSLLYPTQRLDRMVLSTTGLPQGMTVSVGVWSLRSTWK